MKHSREASQAVSLTQMGARADEAVATSDPLDSMTTLSKSNLYVRRRRPNVSSLLLPRLGNSPNAIDHRQSQRYSGLRFI